MQNLEINMELTPKPDNKTNRAIVFIIAFRHTHKREPTVVEVKEGIGGAGNSIIYTAFREANRKGELKITKAQQKHIDTITDIIRAELKNQIKSEVNKLRDASFPRWHEEAEKTYRLQKSLYDTIDSYKPVFTNEEYENIMRCLHPDSRNSISEERLKLAFRRHLWRVKCVYSHLRKLMEIDMKWRMIIETDDPQTMEKYQILIHDDPKAKVLNSKIDWESKQENRKNRTVENRI